MAEITTIARPYAEAVARLAREANSWAAWSDALALVSGVAADPQMQSLASNPSVPAERVAEVILSVCSGKLGTEAANFIKLLVENKRIQVLPEIVRLFEEIKAAQEGVLEAHVSTAYELSAEQLAGLVARLEQKFGQKVTATQSVDVALIGGVIITVGDEVLDASVRGRLADLAVTLNG